MDKKSIWLDAWYDPVAGIRAFGNCISVSDVFADGDHKLIVADDDRKLKIYKGTNLQSEHALIDAPVALTTFYSDLQQPRIPDIAIAAGSFVFIYKNLRPFYKFSITLPAIALAKEEEDIWEDIQKGKTNLKVVTQSLQALRNNGMSISKRSTDLLALTHTIEQEHFVERYQGVPLIEKTYITCMTSIRKSRAEWDAVSCIVLGTEANQILILDPQGTKIKTQTLIPSCPVILARTGLLDVEYRIIVACRNGTIYTVKNGELLRKCIDMESPVSAMVMFDKTIVVGCMDKTMHSFHIKGKKNWTLSLPTQIVAMEFMESNRNIPAVFVGLDNGTIRMYNDQNVLSEFQVSGSITAIRFGPFGRESSSLIIVHKSGAVTVKMLQRKAKLEASADGTGPPPEQDIPLDIPKKTKLYVEQTQRERDQATEMHRIFQKDLCKLRLTTARAYVKIISDGHSNVSTSHGTNIRMTAQVQGIGPLFKIKLNLLNSSTKAASNIPIAFHFDHELYRLKQSLIRVPILLPGLPMQHTITVESLSESGAADCIYIYVCSETSCIPMVSAMVNMPISEPLLA